MNIAYLLVMASFGDNIPLNIRNELTENKNNGPFSATGFSERSQLHT